MSYRGVIQNGVVVLEDDGLPEGTPVEVIPLVKSDSLTNDPAFGIWRDRDDLPDSAEASLRLRRELERRPNG